MYKQDLALNNLQGLICHKTKPTCIPLQRSKTPPPQKRGCSGYGT